MPLDTSAENVAKVLLAVITKLSDIVASVPALFTVIVTSEFWYSDPDSIVMKYRAVLYLNTSKVSTVSTAESMSPFTPYRKLSNSPSFVLEPRSCLYSIAVPVVLPPDDALNVTVAPDIEALIVCSGVPLLDTRA